MANGVNSTHNMIIFFKPPSIDKVVAVVVNTHNEVLSKKLSFILCLAIQTMKNLSLC